MFGSWGHNPVGSWGPRVSVGATVGALWQGEPLPLGPAGDSSGHPRAEEEAGAGHAQAGAQCHPVTACDLRGDSWGSLQGDCCKGAEAWKLQRGHPRALWRTESRETIDVVALWLQGTRSKALGLSCHAWSEGFAQLTQVLTEAKCWASWG